MGKKVSIIVPVYGVEEWLERCMESLVHQTLQDIEIIVVNDGSPDNSQEIIDRYVKEYPDLVQGHIKENGGLYGAGIFVAGSDFTVSDCVFDKNTAFGKGDMTPNNNNGAAIEVTDTNKAIAGIITGSNFPPADAVRARTPARQLSSVCVIFILSGIILKNYRFRIC